MVEQQEFEHALALLERSFREDVHYLAFRGRRRARWHELRTLLHLDEAHATVARDGKARVVAVVRHENARQPRGLENRGAGRHVHLLPFNGECDARGIRHYAAAVAPIGHRLPLMCASNSSRNFLSPETMGTAQESLSTQMVVPVMFVESSCRVSRSSMTP